MFPVRDTSTFPIVRALIDCLLTFVELFAAPTDLSAPFVAPAVEFVERFVRQPQKTAPKRIVSAHLSRTRTFTGGIYHCSKYKKKRYDLLTRLLALLGNGMAINLFHFDGPDVANIRFLLDTYQSRPNMTGDFFAQSLHKSSLK